ncbi:MAG: hypothetical protein RLZZ312_765 [Bacteroidota bacterium]|jgi:subtilisin family serine protease
MKKITVLITILISYFAYSQQDAWVYFNAKPNATAFFANPLSELSQRSLDRRTVQNIALDSRDAPIHPQYIDQITASTGITVMAKSKWLNALHIRGSAQNINALTINSFVDNVQFANYVLNPTSNKIALQNSNLENEAEQNLTTSFNYGNSNNQISMLNGHLLHQHNFTGAGKIIAVMDSGFPGVNTTQPFARLRDSNKILGGYDFVLRNQNFYTSNSHGTMVLATMGGYTENQLVGTAPDASYYLFITENATTENPIEESLWVEAAEEADRLGVDIINTSLGYFEYDNPAYSHTYSRMNGTTTFISRGANIAFTRGMMVVVSAGNSGNSANPNIAAPADATNVLTVGAVDANKNYVTFSSRGPSFDGRTKPDVMAKGLASTVATPSGNISTASGTSFSSPIVAGMVACLWQALPNKSATQIMQMIKQSSDNFSTPNADLGFGIPDFAKALNSSLNIQSSTESQFRAYPNPTTSIINLEIQIMLENTEIKIFNNLGQLIIQKKCNQKTESISVENLPSGLYTYIINNNQQGKFLKH